MPFGFTAKNDSGEVLIDEGFRNFEIVQQGSLSFFDSPVANVYRFSLSYPSTTLPLVFVKIPNSSMFYAPGSSTSTNFRFCTIGLSVAEYIVAAPRENSDAGTAAGLKVVDAAGRVAFSSNRNYVKVGAASNFSASTNNISSPGSFDFSHDACDYSSYVFVPYPGVRVAFCNVLVPWSFQRPSSTTFRVTSPSNSGSTAMGRWNANVGASSDYGGGITTTLSNYPFMIGKP